MGSWLSGPPTGPEDLDGPDGAPREPSGSRLGLPEDGPGSLAGAGRRVIALCIDWAASLLIAGGLSSAARSGTPTILPLVVFFLQVTLLTWLGGASFGQRLLGIRVVGLGARLGLVGALLRTFLIILVVPPVVWDRDGRGLHDKAVGSVVVRA